MKLKGSHSKTARLLYKDLSIQEYLRDGVVNSADAKLLFKFRTRMVNVGCNYRHGCEDVPLCPLCQDAPDEQEHLLLCTALHIIPPPVNYLVIFQCNPDSLSSVVKALKDALCRRELVIEERLERKVEALVVEEDRRT